MAALILLALAIIVTTLQGVSGQQGTACEKSNRAVDLNQCLAGIRFKALDKVNSPYGEAYFKRCPPGERFNINCFEVDKITEPKSLAQLALAVDNPDLSTIDRFLSIHYVCPAGSYSGCDHIYDYPNEMRVHINPLSDNAYPSWDLREPPHYVWNHIHGEGFTLISMDPNGETKLVIVNIQGNDVTNALHLYSYDGLRNFRNSPRPFTFMLYKQTIHQFVERIPSAGFNVTDFAERHQLQGPIAFSLVNAAYDAYNVGRFRYGENCAGLVQDALRSVLPRVEYLPNEVELKVFLRVHHSTTATPYKCGDVTIIPPARQFYIDPIDPVNLRLGTADIRPETLTTMTMTMNKVNPRPTDFDGKLHTIMMISSATKALHGMIVNVEGDNVTTQFGRVSSGFNPVPYIVPNLIETGQNHFFHTLAYEQAARIPTTLDLTPYLSCSEIREFTNLHEFIQDHQLTLVGVSRMMFKDNDEYSRCRRGNA